VIVAILSLTMGRPVSVAWAAEASAEPKISERLTDLQAKHHYAIANGYFDEGRYGLAAQELGLVYAIEPLPELLLQRALVLDAAGRCEEGIVLLEDFLAGAPSPTKEQRASYMLEDCRKRRGLPASAPASAGKVSPEQPENDPATDHASASGRGEETRAVDASKGARPWLRDPAGGVLLGVGLAAMVTGGGLLIASAQAQRAAQMSMLHTDYAASFRRATLLQSFGGGATVAGAALTIGALLRYRGKRRSDARALAGGPWVERGGLGLTVGGYF